MSRLFTVCGLAVVLCLSGVVSYSLERGHNVRDCDDCNTAVDMLFSLRDNSDFLLTDCEGMEGKVREKCVRVLNEWGSDKLRENPSQACMHIGICPLDDVSDADTLLSTPSVTETSEATEDPMFAEEHAQASATSSAGAEEEMHSDNGEPIEDPEENEHDEEAALATDSEEESSRAEDDDEDDEDNDEDDNSISDEAAEKLKNLLKQNPHDAALMQAAKVIEDDELLQDALAADNSKDPALFDDELIGEDRGENDLLFENDEAPSISNADSLSSDESNQIEDDEDESSPSEQKEDQSDLESEGAEVSQAAGTNEKNTAADDAESLVDGPVDVATGNTLVEQNQDKFMQMTQHDALDDTDVLVADSAEDKDEDEEEAEDEDTEEDTEEDTDEDTDSDEDDDEIDASDVAHFAEKLASILETKADKVEAQAASPDVLVSETETETNSAEETTETNGSPAPALYASMEDYQAKLPDRLNVLSEHDVSTDVLLARLDRDVDGMIEEIQKPEEPVFDFAKEKDEE